MNIEKQKEFIDHIFIFHVTLRMKHFILIMDFLLTNHWYRCRVQSSLPLFSSLSVGCTAHSVTNTVEIECRKKIIVLFFALKPFVWFPTNAMFHPFQMTERIYKYYMRFVALASLFVS